MKSFEKGDKVKITKGFYKGFHGIITNEIYTPYIKGNMNPDYEVYIPLIKESKIFLPEN